MGLPLQVEILRGVNIVLCVAGQAFQFGTILGAKHTFLLHRNFNLALKLFQTGNPVAGYQKKRIQLDINKTKVKLNNSHSYESMVIMIK